MLIINYHTKNIHHNNSTRGMEMKERVTISLEANLLRKIDGKRGLIPRSAWIEAFLRGDSQVTF